jgi:hypothetical protein
LICFIWSIYFYFYFQQTADVYCNALSAMLCIVLFREHLYLLPSLSDKMLKSYILFLLLTLILTAWGLKEPVTCYITINE